jgi:hypothetical protein
MMCHTAIMNGQFHGVIEATTPKLDALRRGFLDQLHGDFLPGRVAGPGGGAHDFGERQLQRLALLLHDQPGQGVGCLLDVGGDGQQALATVGVAAVAPGLERGVRGVDGLVELRQRARRALGEHLAGGGVDHIEATLFTRHWQPIDMHRVVLHWKPSFHTLTGRANWRRPGFA